MGTTVILKINKLPSPNRSR